MFLTKCDKNVMSEGEPESISKNETKILEKLVETFDCMLELFKKIN